MAFFSPDFLARVRSANEISQIVGSYSIQLTRAGTNLKGLCPFHNEKTPSFNVKPADQFFYCFGCGAKGDVFRFVQMMEKVEFPEAVRILAERAGVPIEFENPAEARIAQGASREKTALLWCCSRATEYFEDCLAAPSGAPARDYLERRGFSRETIQHWRIGWAPDTWDGLYDFLVKSAKEPGEKAKVIEYAVKAGLLRKREGEHGRGDRIYDYFRGRVMFPILDAQSRPIGFGGRILVDKEGVGKYFNSPEGRLFEKRRVLFGLTQASKEIALTGEAIVVEGYTDVIMCHQYGIRNVVATLGTALTEDHVSLLRRHLGGKGKVIAFFDSDSAGQNATLRAIDMFMAENVPLAVAPRLELKDAGDFLPKYGEEAFRKKLTQAVDSFTYLLEITLGRARDRDPQSMSRAVREVMTTVNLCPDPVAAALMRQQVAAVAGVPESTLPEPEVKTPVAHGVVGANRLARPSEKRGLTPSDDGLKFTEVIQQNAASRMKRELRLLRYMRENPEWCARVVDVFPPDEWRDGALGELAALIRDVWDDNQTPVLADILARASHPDASERLAELAFPDNEPMSDRDLSMLLGRFTEADRKEAIRLLREDQERAQAAGEIDRAMALMNQIIELRRLGTARRAQSDARRHRR